MLLSTKIFLSICEQCGCTDKYYKYIYRWRFANELHFRQFYTKGNKPLIKSFYFEMFFFCIVQKEIKLFFQKYSNTKNIQTVNSLYMGLFSECLDMCMYDMVLIVFLSDLNFKKKTFYFLYFFRKHITVGNRDFLSKIGGEEINEDASWSPEYISSRKS